jgi:membrane protease YdiL (CAAX protease family)
MTQMVTAMTPATTWFTRLGRSAVTQFLIAMLFVGVPFALSNIVVRFLPAGADMVHLRNGVKVAVLVAAYLGFVRWVEKRSPFELSLQGALKEMSIGVLVGAGLISLAVSLLAACGSYHVTGISDDFPLLRYATFFLAVAAMEEMIFRVLLFRLIEKSLGSVIATALSTALFGLAHLVNPNSTWISITSLTLISLIFVGSFLLTRRLWLCMGLHWAWNFFQALYSVAVSGTETKGLLNGEITGPAWLTGGGFGLEASLVTLMLSTFTAGFLLYIAHKKGRFVAPYWRSRFQG